MAEVWAAQLLAPGGFCKSLVLKRVLPDLASDPQFLRMFLDEARVAARLSHANICSVFELGDVAGEYYIAMEYLRGAPLTSLVELAGPLPVPVAVGLVAQACDGMHYAHELRDNGGAPIGLVHRDVSPHNLFVTVDGVVKVLDFGIAKADDNHDRTEAGKVKGKLPYMSPEQVCGDRLDRRTDVWSLGVVLFELLTGRRLFARPAPAVTVDAIRNPRVPLLASAGVMEPGRLDEVLGKALCANREWRYGSAAELKRAMLEAIRPTTVAASEELGHLVWEWCRDLVRAGDQLFDSDGNKSKVGRLPLRAEPTVTSDAVAAVGGNTAYHAVEAIIGSFDGVDGTQADATIDDQPERAHDPLPMLSLPARSRWRWLAWLAVPVAVGVGVRLGLDWQDPPPRPVVPEPALVTTPAPPPAVAAAELAPPAEAPREVTPVVPENVARPSRPTRSSGDHKPKPRPVRDPDSKRTPARTADPEPAPRPTRRGTGRLFVDAAPWATIYLDGSKLGVTPLVGVSIPSGDHTLKAVAEDGKTRTLTIHVDPEGVVRKRVRW